MTVNASALAIRSEMEAMLAPSPSLAQDVRCKVFHRAEAEAATSKGSAASEGGLAAAGTVAAAAAGGTVAGPTAGNTAALQLPGGGGGAPSGPPPLTAGGLQSYGAVEEALANFQQRCLELESQRQLIMEFEALANEDRSTCSASVVDVGEVLLQKLAEFRLFWRSASEWDRSVDRYMRLRPDRVRVNEVQRQAHMTLRAVRCCPEEHRRLLWERVDAFRCLLQPLFMVQVLISLSPSRALAADGTHHLTSDGQRSSTEKQSSNNNQTFMEQVPLFSPEQNHIWEGIFGSTSSGSMADLTESITTVRALIGTGLRYKGPQVVRHYNLAKAEMGAVHELIEAVRFWSHRHLGVNLSAACTVPLVAAGSALLERFQEHLGTIDQLLARSCPYDSEAKESPVGGLAHCKTPVSASYVSLAKQWQGLGSP
mmetsp:Transcript_72557/g.235747  ORF Transcript_72557/g.235747 Transcript_72557/m.235747 type:complete len:426 (+) Transcript_72557:62-1339(+)